MRWTDYDSATCSVARTVDLIGDRWTMLVLRDLFNGVRRFDELAGHLGVARDLLTRRLTALTEAGVVDRHPYQEPGRRTRFEYRLTDAGYELRPVLLALAQWGDKHLAGQDGPPTAVEHKNCGATVHLSMFCDHGHQIDDGHELRMIPLPAARLVC